MHVRDGLAQAHELDLTAEEVDRLLAGFRVHRDDVDGAVVDHHAHGEEVAADVVGVGIARQLAAV
ncbi:MAG: hypothetical protein U0168_31030 [Nannocystaceae bacterium]